MAFSRNPRRPHRPGGGPPHPRPGYPSGPRRRPQPNAGGPPQRDGSSSYPPKGGPRRRPHPKAGGSTQQGPYWKSPRRPPQYERPEARIHPPEEEQEFRYRQRQEQTPETPDAPEGADSVIVGRKPILEALEGGKGVEKVYIQFGTHGSAISAIFRLAKQRGIPVQQATRERLGALGGAQDNQGVVAVVSAISYLELDELLKLIPEGTPARLLVLDEIEDPHNVGALLRSALCFGFHGAIMPQHHSATVNATVVKTSAGAALSLPIARISNVVNVVDALKHLGIKVAGLEGTAETTLDASLLSGPIALVIGNEGRGVRRLVKEHCDLLVKIPMSGSFDSLNASVAGAIAMYEVSRSRSV